METGASQNWRYVGWLCFIILFLSLSYYLVSVAYPFGYFLDTLKLFSNGVGDSGWSLTSNTIGLEICLLVFLLLTMIVIVRGINRGLEEISLITVPIYFILLLGLAIYVCLQGNFGAAFNYLFHTSPDQGALTVFVAALTFAFFKLNVGMGSMMVYGSYLPYSVPLGKSTAIIILLDAIASILSYFIICPLLLQSPLVSSQEVLSYQNVLQIFMNTPHGVLVACLFFFAALLAAWTPTIAMAESATLILIERLEIKRFSAAFLISVIAVVAGTVFVLSETQWQDITLFSTWTIAGFIANFASDIATPASAFMVAVFCGWIVGSSISESELGFKSSLYSFWRFLIRYVAPIGILLIVWAIGFS
jgi:NSS family neurotransmitter:Na+ symporter